MRAFGRGAVGVLVGVVVQVLERAYVRVGVRVFLTALVRVATSIFDSRHAG